MDQCWRRGSKESKGSCGRGGHCQTIRCPRGDDGAPSNPRLLISCGVGGEGEVSRIDKYRDLLDVIKKYLDDEIGPCVYAERIDGSFFFSVAGTKKLNLTVRRR